LAQLLVEHSCELEPNERVFIESVNAPNEIVTALIRATKAVGATPLVALKDDEIIRELSAAYEPDDVKLMAACELHTLQQVQAFISIRAIHNAEAYSAIPPDKLANVLRHYVQPVHLNFRNDNLRWVSLRWPTPAMAHSANLDIEEFTDFFFDVCTVDYARMETAMAPLAELLERTETVRISGPGKTDLSFSISDIGAFKSAGKHNIPDGELFTAPVKDSVEGVINFNVASMYYGRMFEDISLEFRHGQVVNASAASNVTALHEILDQDAGARYVGEFAFGVHPMITSPINDILFDEKISGSVHLALGNAYKVCDNGNRSAIHWDLVLIQSAEMGGGNVYCDDVLIRKDGRFVLPQLTALNPENLH